MSGEPLCFGVRHLSPAGAFHLRRLLDDVRPQLVLVEAPVDLEPLLPDIVRPGTRPPIAMLAYTREPPVRSLLYPLMVYSPEYQAILWAREHDVPCRFMDLPSDVLLALLPECAGTGDDAYGEAEEESDAQAAAAGESDTPGKSGTDGGTGSGEEQEFFWERVLEHAADGEAYRLGAAACGRQLRLRAAAEGQGLRRKLAGLHIREAHMRRIMAQAVAAGVPAGRMVAVTGACHLEGLQTVPPLTDAELAALPRRPAGCTLMPYACKHLADRAGSGTGHKTPAYAFQIWQGLCNGDPRWHVRAYLTRLARLLRRKGQPVSTADVIAAVRLADALALLRGSAVPALPDLRDAAIACLGGGSLARISRAMTTTEVGARVGRLPERVSRTCLQDDFYRHLRELGLERFLTSGGSSLYLDLRENRRVTSGQFACLALRRSFFLHRLRVLGISFVSPHARQTAQSEGWNIHWRPETEIELVERSLTGNSIQEAVSFHFRQALDEAASLAAVAAVIEDAFACGMAAELQRAAAALQSVSVEAADLVELAATASRLSFVLRFGDVRRLDTRPLEPLLQQIFLRSCLLLPAACACNGMAAVPLRLAMDRLDETARAHAFLDDALWLRALDGEAERDDGNASLSGFAAAILLERGRMPDDRLQRLVRRRLSAGTPVDRGAGWFAGLAGKNRHALLARISLWESLSQFVDSLDDEEFTRALVVLRRAFAGFSAGEKDAVAEMLGGIWGLSGPQVSATVNAPLGSEAESLLRDIEAFNFDDL